MEQLQGLVDGLREQQAKPEVLDKVPDLILETAEGQREPPTHRACETGVPAWMREVDPQVKSNRGCVAWNGD